MNEPTDEQIKTWMREGIDAWRETGADYDTYAIKQAYLAGLKDGMEKAARICENNIAVKFNPNGYVAIAAKDNAKEIRSMLEVDKI